MKTTVGKVLTALSGAFVFAFSLSTYAQPRWGSESSPAPQTSTSQKANESADKAVYKSVEYTNVAKA